MMAWKLFRIRKDGTLGSLFIDKQKVRPLGVWMEAEEHLTKGFSFRPGWHCLLSKEAPHLSKKGRIWALVEVEDYQEFERPLSQGGKWLLCKRMKICKAEGGVDK